MQVRTLKDCRLKIGAQADSLHRVHKSVLDLWDGCDEFAVPAGVECTHRLLDQSVWLAERRVYCSSKADWSGAIMGRKWTMPRFRQRRDLAAFRQAAGPAKVHHGNMRGVALQKFLKGPPRA